MKRLIAFAGQMGSGKSYAADYLCREFGYTRVKFASPLKDMLRTLGLTETHIEGELKNKPCELLCGKTPRWAMQTLGTEWGRDLIGNGLWGNIWQQRVEALLRQNRPVVVDDCRFKDEAERVRRMGGTVVLLLDLSQKPDETHSSEVIDVAPCMAIDNTAKDSRRLIEGLTATVLGIESAVLDYEHNGPPK
jgi:hypothetical protein